MQEYKGKFNEAGVSSHQLAVNPVLVLLSDINIAINYHIERESKEKMRDKAFFPFLVLVAVVANFVCIHATTEPEECPGM